MHWLEWFVYIFYYFVGDQVISFGCLRWSIEYCVLEYAVVIETIGIICLALYPDDLFLLSHLQVA